MYSLQAVTNSTTCLGFLLNNSGLATSACYSWSLINPTPPINTMIWTYMTAIYSACYVIRSCSCSVVWLASVFQLIFYEGREINSSDDDSSSSINGEDENSSVEEKIILLSLPVSYFKLDAISVSVNRYSSYLASQ